MQTYPHSPQPHSLIFPLESYKHLSPPAKWFVKMWSLFSYAISMPVLFDTMWNGRKQEENALHRELLNCLMIEYTEVL